MSCRIKRMQPKYGKIALLHHVGSGNLGDDATLDTVIQNIKRRRPNAVIAAFTANPDDTKKRHQIPCYPIRTKPWTWYAPPSSEPIPESAMRALARKYRYLFSLPRLCYTLAFRLPKAFIPKFHFWLHRGRL